MSISVIVPTYNRVELLSRTLGALRNQRYAGDWELVVSDDGSTDGTQDYVRSLQGSFPVPLVYVQGSNGGPALARNRAIAACSHSWVAMTDDDCIPDSEWLSELHAALELHPDAAGLEGRILCPDRDPLQHWVENLQGSQFWTANMTYSRVVLGKLGGFDETFPFPSNEDVDLALRAKALGPIVFVASALVVHPPRPQSISAASKKFVNALESEWVFFRRNPSAYREFKPLRHPRITVWFLLLLQPLSMARHRWRYFVRRPVALSKYLALLISERWHALRGWRRWLC